jgi:hypothetical protein
MHPVPADFDIMGGVNPVQSELAPGSCDYVFDQCAGETQAAIVAQLASRVNGTDFQ